VIDIAAMSTRRAPLALANITLAWGPGVHALVGAPADGGRLLLAVIAGAMRPRTGRVRVLDGAPTDARVRKAVAYVPAEPLLPDALRVDEALAVAAAIRGEPVRPAAERLAVLGVEGLARRTVRSLSRAEVRAVALCEALGSSRVSALLVDEPLIAMEPQAAARVADALRAKARDGCAVIVATGSLRDAGELADDFVFLKAGAISSRTSSLDDLAGFAPRGARLTIISPDVAGARALVAHLAREADVDGIEYDVPLRGFARDDGGGGVVRIRGQNGIILARAAARAAIEAGVDIRQMRLDPLSIEDARNASCALADARYGGAYTSVQSAPAPIAPSEPGAPPGASPAETRP
jgi:ABC-2 type transport system ATP-binding protein